MNTRNSDPGDSPSGPRHVRFTFLHATPVRITAPHIPVPNSIPLENAYLRPESELLDAVKKLTAIGFHKPKQH